MNQWNLVDYFTVTTCIWKFSVVMQCIANQEAIAQTPKRHVYFGTATPRLPLRRVYSGIPAARKHICIRGYK
jgi:hypothetical protein